MKIETQDGSPRDLHLVTDSCLMIRGPKHLQTSLQLATSGNLKLTKHDDRLYSSLRIFSTSYSQHQEENSLEISKNKVRYTRRQWMVLLSLIYGNFWSAACVSLQAPFFPKEAELKGATPSEYGLVFGIYELMILTTSPLFARLVFKYSAINICKLGILINGLSVMCFGLIDQLPAGRNFIYTAYLIRIVEGLAASAFMTTSYTVMAAIFQSNVATVFSCLEVALGLGLIFGNVIGGALYELAGFALPFTLIGGFLFVGFFVLHACIQECPSSSMQSNQKKPNMFAFFFDPAILFDAMAIITSLALIGFNCATLEPHIRQFDLSSFYIGLVFAINGAIYAASTPFWGKLCDLKYNPKVMIVLGYFICSLGLVILGPLSFIPIKPSMSLVIASLIITGFGMAAKLVCSFVDAINNSIDGRGMPNDVGTYGLVSAVFFTSCSIGASIGPSAGGFLLENFNYRPSTIVVFSIESFMTIFGLIYICISKTNNKQKQYTTLA